MARGAWTAVAHTAAWMANVVSMSEEPIQPRDIDPYRLLQDDERRPEDDGRMPYNPAVLEAIQNSGKFG